jgi:hypothetical protein
MTYNERVQAIAEEMAKNEYDKKPKTKFSYSQGYIVILWDSLPDISKRIENKLEDARIAVKHMAEVVKEAYMDVAWWELTPYLFNNGFISEDNENWKEFNSMPGEINHCEACHINEQIFKGEIAGVKQMPRHTCGIDGPDRSSAINETIKSSYGGPSK